MIFGYINGHPCHLPKLNYRCKIEYLHVDLTFEERKMLGWVFLELLGENGNSM